MAYGLSASADGKDVPVDLQSAGHLLGRPVAFIRYIGDKEGGLDKLKGKTIGFIHLDARYGREPIPLLQALAKDYGFELKQYPVPAPQMQNQSRSGSTFAATGRTG